VFNPHAADTIARDRMRSARSQAAHAEDDISTALKYATPFLSCSKRELKLVAKTAKTRNMRAGTKLLVEGEQGDTMYVMLSGQADVEKAGRKIAKLRPGDVVGELSALSKGPRNATVTMTADGEVAIIGRRELRKLLEGAPDFAQKLLETLANRIRELDKKLVC
jgi:CRP-like cAMP-binding protein